MKFFAASIAVALSHLHNNNYIYRDLKPENVLFDENGYLKLTDFGLAKYLPQNKLAETFCGTALYMAPETILSKGCNASYDWWSLGILLYELLIGIPPFYSKDTQKVYQKACCKRLKFRRY